MPFLVSIPFFDASGGLKIDLIPFKLIMAACLVVAALLANRRWTVSARTVWGGVAIACLLDVAVLGLLFGQPITVIATQVAPMYLLVPATIALMQTKNLNGEPLNGSKNQELAR